MTHPPLDPAAKVAALRSKIPAGGLFAEKEWRLSPEALPLGPRHIELLEKLGPLLHRFNQACNLLYRQSVRGRQPAWIAALLDRGKPADLIEASRADKTGQHLPAVIRPDLIVTENGFALCELDSVPGGIGLTAWLSETYADLGEPVYGGRDGMRNGFAAIFPEGDVVISEESATYRPEMEFLVGPERVRSAEGYRADGKPLYRFFECFDWHLPELGALRESWGNAGPVTPPLKPYMEEKLWLALFWLQPLLPFWRRELGDKGVALLKEVIPYSWVVDPTPLPPHAVLPGLEIQDWREMAQFSQVQRDLILKISGFSPLAWGSRGVYLGSDLSAAAWQEAIDKALTEFPTHPYVLQKFVKGSLLEHPYYDEAGTLQTLRGRARLCPYYFAASAEQRPLLGGVLAAICPSDKKLLHGMRDAVLVPVKQAAV